MSKWCPLLNPNSQVMSRSSRAQGWQRRPRQENSAPHACPCEMSRKGIDAVDPTTDTGACCQVGMGRWGGTSTKEQDLQKQPVGTSVNFSETASSIPQTGYLYSKSCQITTENIKFYPFFFGDQKNCPRTQIISNTSHLKSQYWTNIDTLCLDK